jgi:hypothetical protein
MEAKGHGKKEDYLSFRAVAFNCAYIMRHFIHIRTMMCHSVRCVDVNIFTTSHQVQVHFNLYRYIYIVTCYLLTRRIIYVGCRSLYLDLLDITSGGVYNHLKRFQLHHMN